MNFLLNKLEEEKSNLAPTFAFIDPFGYSDADVLILARILKFKKCELLITYMVGFLDRFVHDYKQKESIKQMLGISDDELESIRKIEEKEEREEMWLKIFVDKICQIVRTNNREVYSLSFKVKDRMNRTMYYLIHLTGHLSGVERMKDSKWKVGKEGKYVFSDYDFNPYQKSILDYSNEKPWISEAASQLHSNFKGREIGVPELRQFILLNTPWIWRKKILRKLEEDGRIEYIGRRPRKYSYLEDGVIRFL